MQAVQRAWQDRQNELQQVLRDELPESLVKSEQQRLLDDFIRRELLVQRAAEAGFRVSDADLVEAIAAIPALQVDGRFSRDRYAAVLRSQGRTETQFENDFRRDLEVSQLSNGDRRIRIRVAGRAEPSHRPRGRDARRRICGAARRGICGRRRGHARAGRGLVRKERREPPHARVRGPAVRAPRPGGRRGRGRSDRGRAARVLRAGGARALRFDRAAARAPHPDRGGRRRRGGAREGRAARNAGQGRRGFCDAGHARTRTTRARRGRVATSAGRRARASWRRSPKRCSRWRLARSADRSRRSSVIT